MTTKASSQSRLRKRLTSSVIGGIITLLLALNINVGQAAPNTFNTALPIGEGELVVREQFIVRERSAAGRELRARVLASALGWGLNADWALFAVVPLVQKRLQAESLPFEREAKGLGDAQLFARYSLWRKDSPGATLRIAPFAGLIAPTGEDSERDSLGRLPRPLQTGNGAWGGLTGIVITRQTLRWQADAQIAYSSWGRDEGYQPGALSQLDLSWQQRFAVIGKRRPAFFYGLLEANLSHRERDSLRSANPEQLDTGGSQLLLSPGLQLVTQRWIVEAVLQLPVIQNSHGDALEDDRVFRIGFRRNF